MTFHIAFRTTLLTGCDRFNHFLQLTPLLELEKVFGSRLTGRETFPFVSKKKGLESGRLERPQEAIDVALG